MEFEYIENGLLSAELRSIDQARHLRDSRNHFETDHSEIRKYYEFEIITKPVPPLSDISTLLRHSEPLRLSEQHMAGTCQCHILKKAKEVNRFKRNKVSQENLPSIPVGSLSKGVFERRTATGNETFSLFTRLGATTFVILSVLTRIETIDLQIRAHPLPKNEKCSLPVAARRSK